MLNQPMVEKLHALRLRGMADGFAQQQEDPQYRQLAFEERLALLVDQQWNWRQNRALARRLKEGRLLGPACVEDLDYRAARGLDRQLVRSLLHDSDWVRRHHPIFITGATGLGKTYLAKAFGQKAEQLFRELELARADGRYLKMLRTLSHADALIVDDWAMVAMTDHDRRAFLEIADARYQTGATLLTSQYPVAKWHAQIGDPTIADSILDRLVHTAHRLELKGDSIRSRGGKDEAQG